MYCLFHLRWAGAAALVALTMSQAPVSSRDPSCPGRRGLAERPSPTRRAVGAGALGVPELRLLVAIAPAGTNALFFVGDLGQRIFQQPFSWTTLGVDVRGHCQTLKVNYRTSHQIRQAADRLLPDVMRDVDGREDQRLGTVSVFNGPDPLITTYPDVNAEAAAVGHWISQAITVGSSPLRLVFSYELTLSSIVHAPLRPRPTMKS
jgi:hypothetical protein